MAQESVNYWLWKDSEIENHAVHQCGLKREDLGEFNRKTYIEAIKKYDAQVQKETKSYIDKLKEEEPTLEMRRVVFHSIGEMDMPYVFVGHNGLSYYLPKEIEIDVPKYILDSCIKDAVEERTYQVVHPNGDIEHRTRKVQRFPYSIVE